MTFSFKETTHARSCRRQAPIGRMLTAVVSMALLCNAPLTAQQTGTIQGQVTSGTTAEPLVGAQIVIESSGIGTLTDNRGKYTLAAVPAGQQEVTFRIIGYGTETRPVTVTVGATTTLDVQLYEQAIEMDAVIVTGTAGTARRREIGNSVAQVDVQQIETSPISGVSDVLQGRVAGVQILGNSGMVGTGSTIRLRGNKSISGGNSPLIYVDGVRLTSRDYGYSDEMAQAASPLADLDPNDIDRIEIVKGAAATTLYGTEAAGGVIQIFTKKGAAGEPVWNVSVDQGINRMGHVGPESDISGMNLNDCTVQVPADPTCPESGSWLRDGYVQRYNLSVRGGGETMTYYVSGNVDSEEGVIPTQGASSWGARGNFSFIPSDDLRFQFNSNYVRRDINWVPDGSNAEGFITNVLRGDRGSTPDNRDLEALDLELGTATHRFITGLGVNWTPMASMSHRLNVGVDYSNSEYTEYRPWLFYYLEDGNRRNTQRTNRVMTLDYSGSWKTSLPASLSSTFSWGGQAYDDDYVLLSGYGEGFAGPGDKVVDSGARTESNENRVHTTSGGLFLQEMIGWDDRLFLTVGGRWDGFSSFGEDFGMAFYPKLSASYMISEHAIWPEWWDAMKLRAAIGESGRAPGPFDALRTWSSVSGDEGQPAVTPRSVGAPDLGPERTREWEAGFEAALLNGRVTADFTYYNQKTYDALVPVQPMPSSGLGVFTQLRNVGEIQNHGTETMLSFIPVRTDNVNWDVGIRYATTQSEVVSLIEGLSSIYIGWRNEARPGFALPSYFHNAVMNPDAVGVEPIIENDQYIGPAYPNSTWGLNTSIALWKSLTLTALGEYQGGHYLQNGTGYQQMRRGMWVPCQGVQAEYEANPDNDKFAGLRAGDVAKCIPDYSGYGIWTMPADFFKLRSASISYQIPDSWLGERLNSATVTLQGRNLLTITDYDGLDPEAAQDGSSALYRMEYYNIPPFRSYIVNFRVAF
ncbi:MAG TPA: TonB-dependent receptor [Longimicrobiaceae bacterium]|nr:TonB-dependent receptor [Longimicrobiaceae bacterium]